MVVVHDTISNQIGYSEKTEFALPNVVREHYRRVAGSLIFGKLRSANTTLALLVWWFL
jgi:hypothetical protein